MKIPVAAMLVTNIAAPAAAQQWQWPDKPKNLQVVNLNIEMFPEFAFSYVHLANYFEGRGNIQAAMENCEQAVKLNPKDERLRRQLERPQAKENRR
jgi:predicted TPR repeat methyltransferase